MRRSYAAKVPSTVFIFGAISMNTYMEMKKKPFSGMKDILPNEMQIRDYVMNLIKETYRGFGFLQIETPCVEQIENLSSRQGGENEKLIFKILKRGEKLDVKSAEKAEELVDSGLRYDLTLPLSRYYANNANELPSPFKALQMGNVWRAERQQHGRFRQFVQCDIDILGEASYLAEVELILATTTLLGKLDFKNFKVRINDRRILKAMAQYSGFPEELYDTVFIILDKLDKIGLEGVERELLKNGFDEEQVKRYLGLFEVIQANPDIAALAEKLDGYLDKETAENLKKIIFCVDETKNGNFFVVFDPSLVRGMSYYTGTIFEIEMEEFESSVAGGGRYDEMIGRFTGIPTCACGFSIGFERIVTILLEKGFVIPTNKNKKVFLYEKTLPTEQILRILKLAERERAAGVQVLVTSMNKNKKFQKERLLKEGYIELKEFYRDTFEKEKEEQN